MRLPEQGTITPEMVRDAVEKVKEASSDYEIAHSMEDDLHQSVLLAISRGHAEDPRLCAFIALETLKLDFPRYCA